MKNSNELNVREILACLWNNCLLIIAVGALMAGVGLAYGVLRTQSEATAAVEALVVDTREEYDPARSRQLAELCRSLLETDGVCDTLCERAGLEEIVAGKQLNACSTVVLADDSSILRIEITAPDAEQAERLRDIVAARLPEVCEELAGGQTIVLSASEVTTAERSGALKAAALGLFAGVALTMLAVVIYRLLDNTVGGTDELLRSCELPVVGVIPRTGGKARLFGFEALRRRPDRMATASLPEKWQLAGYDSLLGSLTIEKALTGRRALVLSCDAPNGVRDRAALGLAVTAARGGDKVLLIDAAFGGSGVRERLGGGTGRGLSDLLAGLCDVRDAAVSVEPGVDYLPSGERPAELCALIISEAGSERLARLEEGYDWVIVNAPDIGRASPEALLLAERSAGVLLVLGAEETNYDSLRRAAAKLAGARCATLGAVLFSDR